LAEQGKLDPTWVGKAEWVKAAPRVCTEDTRGDRGGQSTTL